MASHHRRERLVARIVLWVVVTMTLIGALVTAGGLTSAEASSRTDPADTALAPTGPTVADLVPAPPLPDRILPAFPLPTPEPVAGTEPGAGTEPAGTIEGGTSGHCGDRAWWSSRQEGDPSDYVAACGSWPSWIERGETTCLPGEHGCAEPGDQDATGAAPYTGPTGGRAWSPEYGYYEGRTDGPKNSDGEPCMQGRDNNDPNC